MNQSPGNKFIAFLIIIAAPFALGAFLLAWSPAKQYELTDPEQDGYVTPRSISSLVERTQASTVTIWCKPKVGKESQGTAWVIELETKLSGEYPTTLITNHHVIEDCIGGAGTVKIALLYEEPVAAAIVEWDKENDIAVVASAKRLPVLKLSDNPPYPGYWVMALGSADGYEGSVSFGNVINTNSAEILMTNNISHGSSGGPLIDNEGFVLGITSWGLKEEQYNGAKSLDAFCAKILKCEYGDGKTWWDYKSD